MQTSEEGSLELGLKSSNVLQWNALDYCKKFSLGRKNTNILTSVCGNISIIILTPPSPVGPLDDLLLLLDTLWKCHVIQPADMPWFDACISMFEFNIYFLWSVIEFGV